MPTAHAVSRFRVTKRSIRWCTAVCIRLTVQKYPDLRDALEKLQINDASLQYEPETSLALGFWVSAADFLGLLHLEIIQERLEREFNLDLVTTAPGLFTKCTRQTERSWI